MIKRSRLAMAIAIAAPLAIAAAGNRSLHRRFPVLAHLKRRQLPL